MKNINFNQIITKTSNSVKKVSEFENTKAVYDGYVKKIEKTDFANSVTRYEVELKMLELLKELAQKHQLTTELEGLESKIKNAKGKLIEFGITIKD